MVEAERNLEEREGDLEIPWVVEVESYSSV
jgi:hypothetical protein